MRAHFSPEGGEFGGTVGGGPFYPDAGPGIIGRPPGFDPTSENQPFADPTSDKK